MPLTRSIRLLATGWLHCPCTVGSCADGAMLLLGQQCLGMRLGHWCRIYWGQGKGPIASLTHAMCFLATGWLHCLRMVGSCADGATLLHGQLCLGEFIKSWCRETFWGMGRGPSEPRTHTFCLLATGWLHRLCTVGSCADGAIILHGQLCLGAHLTCWCLGVHNQDWFSKGQRPMFSASCRDAILQPVFQLATCISSGDCRRLCLGAPFTLRKASTWCLWDLVQQHHKCVGCFGCECKAGFLLLSDEAASFDLFHRCQRLSGDFCFMFEFHNTFLTTGFCDGLPSARAGLGKVLQRQIMLLGLQFFTKASFIAKSTACPDCLWCRRQSLDFMDAQSHGDVNAASASALRHAGEQLADNQYFFISILLNLCSNIAGAFFRTLCLLALAGMFRMLAFSLVLKGGRCNVDNLVRAHRKLYAAAPWRLFLCLSGFSPRLAPDQNIRKDRGGCQRFRIPSRTWLFCFLLVALLQVAAGGTGRHDGLHQTGFRAQRRARKLGHAIINTRRACRHMDSPPTPPPSPTPPDPESPDSSDDGFWDTSTFYLKLFGLGMAQESLVVSFRTGVEARVAADLIVLTLILHAHQVRGSSLQCNPRTCPRLLPAFMDARMVQSCRWLPFAD